MSRVRFFSWGAGTFRESTEFGEDAHQQLLATLHAELAIDAPQVGVHGVRRKPESRGGVLLGIAVEHGAHDAAFARREAETAGERAPFPWNEHSLAGPAHDGLSHGVPIWCALEPRASNDLAAFLLYDEEAMAPRVGSSSLPRGGTQRLEPHG